MVKISCGSPLGEEEFSRFLMNIDPAPTAKYHGTPTRIKEYPARGSSVHVNPFHGEVFAGISYGIPLGGASIIRIPYGIPLGEEAFPRFPHANRLDAHCGILRNIKEYQGISRNTQRGAPELMDFFFDGAVF